ncbi:glycosyltransferase [Flavobacterium macacae]|uniref:Glycosyltransferase n=1 Tax=Flavobacterium macacae TaxID=2488993 RepID=A0A3P3W0A0_9FLAO|nr:glycosyltransferase [Flavobacterium macacae]RRJ88482.1 glycosyltransferase [Flavobacterium macacae]
MINIIFFERIFNTNTISIEKLFNTIYDELRNKGLFIEVIKNPYPLKYFWKSIFFFKKREGGDITHITGDIHWISIFLNPKKTILTIHDLVGLESLSGLKRIFYYLFWIYLPLKRLKYITVISEKIKEDILRLLPSVSKKINVIPNCVTIPINVVNRNYRVNKILFVGTRSNKNIEISLKALEKFNFEITIVGKLSLEQSKIINDLELKVTNKENISEEELIYLYDTHDVLCFTSVYEGFGLPILEAQARGCAVITSNLSPMKDVLGYGGVLINPYDQKDIEFALEKYQTDISFYNKCILEGYKNVSNYTVDNIAEQYINLYEKILKNGFN